MKQRSISFAPNSDIINLIAKAGRERKILAISYIDAKGEETVRDTEPYEIKNGLYYGFSIDKGQIRAFKLENILRATIINRTYVPRWDVKF